MPKLDPVLTDPARKLLSLLLYQGGFCTPALAATALNLHFNSARKLLAELTGFGYVRRVFLLKAHDATSYFQITRKAARIFCVPHPNCARSSPADSQILRGVVRFWYSFQPHQNAELLASDLIALAEFERQKLAAPRAFPVGDTYLLDNDRLQIKVFVSPNQSLDVAVKSAFLRYADNLDAVNIGFVIDRQRYTELQKVLAEITGVPAESTPDLAENQADIQARIETLRAQFAAGSAREKLLANEQIERLQAELAAQKTAQPAQKTAQDDALSGLILPIIVHDFY